MNLRKELLFLLGWAICISLLFAVFFRSRLPLEYFFYIVIPAFFIVLILLYKTKLTDIQLRLSLAILSTILFWNFAEFVIGFNVFTALSVLLIVFAISLYTTRKPLSLFFGM